MRLPEDDADALKHVEYLRYIKILLMHIYAVHLLVRMINKKIIYLFTECNNKGFMGQYESELNLANNS